jgi:hypothetical protein
LNGCTHSDVPGAVPSTEPEHTPESIDHTLRDLADEATALTGVQGVAVYVKAAPRDRFRAHVTWSVNDADLRSPVCLAYVFKRVVETGGPLVRPASRPNLSLRPGRVSGLRRLVDVNHLRRGIIGHRGPEFRKRRERVFGGYLCG